MAEDLSRPWSFLMRVVRSLWLRNASWSAEQPTMAKVVVVEELHVAGKLLARGVLRALPLWIGATLAVIERSVVHMVATCRLTGLTTGRC